MSDGGANVGGATNQGTQSGTVSWTPNTDAAGTYYYQCGNHAGMIGTIIVNDTRTLDLSAGNEVTCSMFQNAGDGSGANGDGTVPKSFFMGFKIGA